MPEIQAFFRPNWWRSPKIRPPSRRLPTLGLDSVIWPLYGESVQYSSSTFARWVWFYCKPHWSINTDNKHTNACSFSDGFLSLTYNLKILFAVVSHREWFKHPGFRIDRSILHSPALIPLQILSKYCWSLLSFLKSTLDRSLVSLTGLKKVTGCWVNVASLIPIDPENPRAPVVVPSRVSNKCRKGNSLAWSKQTSHWREWLNDSSIL